MKDNKFFRGTHPLNHIPCAIPHVDQGFIVNTDPCKDDGQHWVGVVILKNGRGEYFDSFGRQPLQEIIDYFRIHATVYSKSRKMIQHPFSSSCGLFCIQYINHRSKGGDLHSYVSGFSDDLDSNEQSLVRMKAKQTRRPGKV